MEKFSEEKIVTIPVVRGWGKHEGRIMRLGTPDGWYKVRAGDTVEGIKKASPMEIEGAISKLKKYRGLALGGEIVPWNFENLFRKGEGESVPVNFLDAPAWEIVKFVIWEDHRFFAAGTDYGANRLVLNQVKEAFETNKEITDIKGVTPEFRYYFLLLSLQRQSYQQLKELEKLKLSQLEREKRLAEFRESFAGRLEEVIGKAGGKLVRFTKRAKSRYTVIWKIGNQKITSIIDDTMQIYDLGYCASGHDKEHTMSSAIQLARLYREERDIHITRE